MDKELLQGTKDVLEKFGQVSLLVSTAVGILWIANAAENLGELKLPPFGQMVTPKELCQMMPEDMFQELAVYPGQNSAYVEKGIIEPWSVVDVLTGEVVPIENSDIMLQVKVDPKPTDGLVAPAVAGCGTQLAGGDAEAIKFAMNTARVVKDEEGVYIQAAVFESLQQKLIERRQFAWLRMALSGLTGIVGGVWRGTRQKRHWEELINQNYTVGFERHLLNFIGGITEMLKITVYVFAAGEGLALGLISLFLGEMGLTKAQTELNKKLI